MAQIDKEKEWNMDAWEASHVCEDLENLARIGVVKANKKQGSEITSLKTYTFSKGDYDIATVYYN